MRLWPPLGCDLRWNLPSTIGSHWFRACWACTRTRSSQRSRYHTNERHHCLGRLLEVEGKWTPCQTYTRWASWRSILSAPSAYPFRLLPISCWTTACTDSKSAREFPNCRSSHSLSISRVCSEYVLNSASWLTAKLPSTSPPPHPSPHHLLPIMS